MIQGILDGQLQISGKGATLDAIKPTLDGKGRANVRNGKLVGINLAAEGLKKTKGLPGIGDLIPASVVERHQALFNIPIRRSIASRSRSHSRAAPHDA